MNKSTRISHLCEAISTKKLGDQLEGIINPNKVVSDPRSGDITLELEDTILVILSDQFKDAEEVTGSLSLSLKSKVESLLKRLKIESSIKYR
jgi:hypothetical protein